MNRLLFKIALLVPLFLFVGLIGHAQYNDAGVWVGFAVEKKINQAFSVEFAHESRFNENVSEWGSIINQLGITYKLDKKSQFSVFYRSNFQKQLNNQYVPTARIYADYLYKLKPGNFVVTIRLRAQYQQKYSMVFDGDGDPGMAFRPKIAVKYPINKFEPYLSVETNIPVFNNEYKPIDKMRISVGIEYSFNKINSVDLAYMIQREYFTNNPCTDFVFLIGYKFKF